MKRFGKVAWVAGAIVAGLIIWGIISLFALIGGWIGGEDSQETRRTAARGSTKGMVTSYPFFVEGQTYKVAHLDRGQSEDGDPIFIWHLDPEYGSPPQRTRQTDLVGRPVMRQVVTDETLPPQHVRIEFVTELSDPVDGYEMSYSTYRLEYNPTRE